MVSIRQSVHIYKYRGIGEPPKKVRCIRAGGKISG